MQADMVLVHSWESYILHTTGRQLTVILKGPWAKETLKLSLILTHFLQEGQPPKSATPLWDHFFFKPPQDSTVKVRIMPIIHHALFILPVDDISYIFWYCLILQYQICPIFSHHFLWTSKQLSAWPLLIYYCLTSSLYSCQNVFSHISILWCNWLSAFIGKTYLFWH